MRKLILLALPFAMAVCDVQPVAFAADESHDPVITADEVLDVMARLPERQPESCARHVVPACKRPGHYERSIYAHQVASAIVTAVVADEKLPVTESKLQDASLLTVYAAYESGINVRPPPLAWDAMAHISCGVWQEPCDFVASHSLAEQASWWLVSAHAAGVASVDSLPTRAAARVELSKSVLTR